MQLGYSRDVSLRYWMISDILVIDGPPGNFSPEMKLYTDDRPSEKRQNSTAGGKARREASNSVKKWWKAY